DGKDSAGRPGDGAARVPVHVRLERVRAGRDDAGVDAGRGRAPADHLHGGRGAFADAGGGGGGAARPLGHRASYYVGRSLLWTVAIVAVFAPLAVARYRKG